MDNQTNELMTDDGKEVIDSPTNSTAANEDSVTALKMAEWQNELNEIEEEIATLRQVLACKERRCAELKRNLGINVFKEISDSIKTVKETSVYQTVGDHVGKVAKVVSDAPLYQRTSSIIGGITGNLSTTLGRMRRSESIRSMEEKVESVCENVLTKIMHSKGDQNRGSGADSTAASATSSAVTSPTIPEDKPLN